MTKPEINKEILIEELVNNYPFSVRFLMEKGIRCIMCGEPVWGTLEEACQEKNFTEQKINDIIDEMKKLVVKENENNNSGQQVDVEKMNL